MSLAPLLAAIGLAASLAYLLLLPHSALGLVLALAGILLVCAGASTGTLGVACLLMAPALAGAILRAFDVPYIGTFASVALGLFLLYGFGWRGAAVFGRWGPPAAWLVVVVAVLILSYTYGPQTEYCQDKLVRVILGGLVAVIAFGFVASDPAVDLWRLGLIGIVSSVGHYWTVTFHSPELLPSSVWVPCGLRIVSHELDVSMATNMIAAVACLGVVCLASDSLDRRMTKGRMLQGLLALVVAMLLINSAGQRLYMVAPSVAGAAVFLCRPKEKMFPAAVLVITVLAAFGVLLAGLAREDSRFLQTFDTEGTLGQRLNRSMNWDAAIERIGEQPLWGYGLGGYYIDGFSRPGEGTYAHNLFLELASETGTVGALIILVPAGLFLIRMRRRILAHRTPGGASLVPLLVVAFLQAMISFDLKTSFVVFVLTAVLWAYVPPAESPVKSSEPVRSEMVGASRPCGMTSRTLPSACAPTGARRC
ncbi:MAG TPA: O-antigen ligase family protein [Phycisphaerae bacterium]|nr:O-antigen ligase family protein [Phycisphaerae bacterium]